jgi:hypothetical protein
VTDGVAVFASAAGVGCDDTALAQAASNSITTALGANNSCWP